MAYVPNNTQIYTAAYAGAFAGMTVSNRVISNPDSASYAGLAAVAGAWAQEVDTVWGATATTQLDISTIQEESEAAWQNRSPQTTALFQTPSTYANEVTAIIATVTAAEAYFAGQGITPSPAPPIFSGSGIPSFLAGVLTMLQAGVGNIGLARLDNVTGSVLTIAAAVATLLGAFNATNLSAALPGASQTGTAGKVVFDTGPTITDPTIQVQNRNTILIPYTAAFGDGTDGAITVSGASVMTADVYATTYTLNAGANVNPNAMRIFANVSIDFRTAPSLAIQQDMPASNSAVVNAGGLVLSPSPIIAGTASSGVNTLVGPNGGTVNGTAGTATTALTIRLTGLAGAGGAGGNAGANTGGAGGSNSASAGANASRLLNPRGIVIPLGLLSHTNTLQPSFVAPTGGSGAGDGTAGGGGGSGGAGGVGIQIFGFTFLISSTNVNTSIISAKGGNGGNGGVPAAGNRGGGGGGGGGPGGFINLVCNTVSGTTQTNFFDVSTGAGGNGGNSTGTGLAGVGGQAGFGGKIIISRFGDSTINTILDGTSLGGNVAAGQVGGASTQIRFDFAA